MEYTLTKLEYGRMTSRDEHNKQCKAYQDQLKDLSATAHRLRSQYNALYPEKAGQPEATQLTGLLDDLSNYIRKAILFLVEKRGGIISDIEISTIYCGKGNEVLEGIIASVESSGKVTLDDEDTTSLDKLTPDALQSLYDAIYQENTNESM